MEVHFRFQKHMFAYRTYRLHLSQKARERNRRSHERTAVERRRTPVAEPALEAIVSDRAFSGNRQISGWIDSTGL